jgi:anti-sigma B factor antagonist
MRRGELDFHDEVEANRHTLVLSGELDLATSPALERTIERLCADGAEELVIDLRGLLFIDSTGIRTILRSKELCGDRECEFALIRGSASTQRLFELTGLDEKLPFRDGDGSAE